jgi:hypothetical protein
MEMEQREETEVGGGGGGGVGEGEEDKEMEGEEQEEETEEGQPGQGGEEEISQEDQEEDKGEASTGEEGQQPATQGPASTVLTQHRSQSTERLSLSSPSPSSFHRGGAASNLTIEQLSPPEQQIIRAMCTNPFTQDVWGRMWEEVQQGRRRRRRGKGGRKGRIWI